MGKIFALVEVPRRRRAALLIHSYHDTFLFFRRRTDGRGRTDGNFCGRRRRSRGPADGAPAAAAAAAKIEKQITSGRPPVKKKLAPDGRTDETKTKKPKCVSNDSSHHDDQNECRIIKNGAILKG